MKVIVVGVRMKKQFNKTVKVGGKYWIYTPIMADYPSLAKEGNLCALMIPGTNSVNAEMEVYLNDAPLVLRADPEQILLNIGDVIRIEDPAKGYSIKMTIVG